MSTRGTGAPQGVVAWSCLIVPIARPLEALETTLLLFTFQSRLYHPSSPFLQAYLSLVNPIPIWRQLIRNDRPRLPHQQLL